MNRIVVAVVIAALAVAVVLVYAGTRDEGGDSAAPDGGSATGAGGGSLQFIAPDDFSVASYQGKPQVVNFFGSWCGPCNDEAPALAEFAGANPDAQFVGIAVNDSEAAVRDFAQQYGLTFPMVVDDGSLGQEYGISGVPTTIFFDASGNEVDRIVGASDEAGFAAGLQKAQ